MGLALILAVAFIYIVLASQFESFLEPFIIMLSLPLAIVGALLLLLVTGKNIGMPAMIGVVMLMGLVTKNAILLVDYTNQLRARGAERQGRAAQGGAGAAAPDRDDDGRDDARHDCRRRSAAATAASSARRSRSPTIGGLITSTLLTLVVVPVAYMLLERAVERVKVVPQRRRCRPPCARPRA